VPKNSSTIESAVNIPHIEICFAFFIISP
jgi:hypothetical protein